MIVLQKKVGFQFVNFMEFETVNAAEKYVESVYKRMNRKNKKAACDFRPNSYGFTSLPFFMIDGKALNNSLPVSYWKEK